MDRMKLTELYEKFMVVVDLFKPGVAPEVPRRLRPASLLHNPAQLSRLVARRLPGTGMKLGLCHRRTLIRSA